MPTAGRLAGAACFAILGAYLAFLTMPLFDEGKTPSFWLPLCAIAGVWSGWVVVGKRGGRGNAAGIGNGLTGVAALIFWVLFVTSFVDMINKSMRSAYDGPLEALVNVFELAIGHAIRLGTTDVLTAAVCGGIIAGLITEYITKRLP